MLLRYPFLFLGSVLCARTARRRGRVDECNPASQLVWDTWGTVPVRAAAAFVLGDPVAASKHPYACLAAAPVWYTGDAAAEATNSQAELKSVFAESSDDDDDDGNDEPPPLDSSDSEDDE